MCGTNVSRSRNSHFHPHFHFYHVLWNRNWAVQAAMGMGIKSGIWEQKTVMSSLECCEG